MGGEVGGESELGKRKVHWTFDKQGDRGKKRNDSGNDIGDGRGQKAEAQKRRKK